MLNEYEQGTSVEIAWSYRDLHGQLFDPTSVVLIVQEPTKAETTYTYGTTDAIVRDSLGRYFMWILADMPGLWAFKVEGLGAQQVKRSGAFNVVPSSVDVGTPVEAIFGASGITVSLTDDFYALLTFPDGKVLNIGQAELPT